MENITFGEYIKKKRLEKSIKQNILAEKVGITPSYLSLIERNKKSISIKRVKKISEVLNIKFSDFFLGYYEEKSEHIISSKKRKMILEILDDVISCFV